MSNNATTKDDYLIEYIKAFDTVEREMEPFKDHKRDLKKNYIENGWLSKDDISLAVKAYRMIKRGDSIDNLVDIYDNIKTKVI